MLQIVRYLAGVALLILSCGSACGATTVRLATDSSPRLGGWELLEVRVSAPAGGGNFVVGVRDARGGLTVARTLDSAEFSGGREARVLIPLPYVSAAESSGWSVDVVVSSAAQGDAAWEDGRAATRHVVAGGGIRGVGEGNYRVAKLGDDRDEEKVDWRNQSGLPIAFVQVTERDVLEGPPLVFAALDAVLLPRKLAEHMTVERACALLNVGVRLLVAGDAPPAGPIGRLVWEATPATTAADGGSTPTPVWACPHEPLPRPAVIEPELAKIDSLHQRPTATRPMIVATMLVGPAAIVALLLLRGLFRRPAVIVAGSTVVLLSLTAGFASFLRTNAPTVIHRAEWNARRAARETIGAFAVTESLTGESCVFDRTLNVSVDEPALLIPVAGSAREYFALRQAHLKLDVPHDAGGTGGRGTPSTLDMHLTPGNTATYLTRRCDPAGLLPPYPRTPQEREQFAEQTRLDLSRGWWVEEGYVASGDGSRVLLSRWAAAQPQVADSVRAWYEMRFDAARRYFLWRAPATAASQRPEEDRLHIVDFGASAGLPTGSAGGIAP